MKKVITTILLTILFITQSKAGDTIRLHVNSDPQQGGIIQRNLKTNKSGQELDAVKGDVFYILSSELGGKMDIIFDTIPPGVATWDTSIYYSQKIFYSFEIGGRYVYHVDYYDSTLKDRLIINVKCLYNISSSFTNLSCNSDTDATATVIPIGSGAPYQYKWDAAASNQTNSTATELASGDYTVTVTDKSNCSSTKTITIPAASTLTLSPPDQYFPSNGGSDSIVVKTSSSCKWTANTSEPWITITAGGNGTDSGTINYTLSENKDTVQRTGTIIVQGETHTITQAGSLVNAILLSSFNNQQLEIYPNPSDGDFELKILNSKSGINNAVIKIYDVLGREIYKSEITNQSFKIQNLKSKIDKGVYLLQLVTKEGVWNEKIIVNY